MRYEMNNDDDDENPKKPPITLIVDWEFYFSELEKSDLTDDEKREFIGTLWYIVCAFVDLGFGIESTQQAIAARDAARLESSIPDTKKDSGLRAAFKAAAEMQDLDK